MNDINLVDPASSHTLVSKIKPCMSKYKHFCTVKLRMAHYINYSLLDRYGPTMALTGNGELGFHSGEEALETATTSNEGSRRVNYPS
ncbi:hypothetical protein DD237_007534 [Peronospora effusa]|uniref:Uncharacterized protein n=1 Tax=Peronospora effusa TaxID=542832 RepID=A0A425CNG2_9STRA|nr:hypothetical protein DD237_007534 [Peronospora effusa]